MLAQRWQKFLSSAAAGVLTFSVLAAPAASAAGWDETPLRQAMDRVVASGVAGVQARIRDSQGDWSASAGVRALGSNQPPSADGRFRIGSVTKTFVATVVLQLAGERRIGLDTPVNHYLPGLLPGGNRITVRMILQHTSGLYSYSDDLPFGEGATQIAHGFPAIRFRHFTPGQLVAMATAKPLLFEPGQDWSYSDTNYIVAGLLVEKVTGRTWGTEVADRIIRPLGLHATSEPGDNPALPWPYARGYSRLDGKTVDVTELNPTVAGAAGSMISTTADLDDFFRALLSGRLLLPEQLTEMLTPRETNLGIGYGLGIMSIAMPCGTTVWGHTGGIPGYATHAFATADGTRQGAFSVTTDKNPAHGTEGRILTAMFCP
ncbi:serine hydrolase domain-containing protein [Amycolatopsis sp. NPDC054798]